MMTAQIQVHGHRGARAVRPENTIPAFQYAIEQGVDVLELDMAVTKDNVVVVSHDETMNPAYCEGPAGSTRVIREMTFAELQRWDCGGKVNPQFPKQQAIPGTRVPTLDAVFALAKKAKVEFNIETKMAPAHRFSSQCISHAFTKKAHCAASRVSQLISASGARKYIGAMSPACTVSSAAMR